VRIYKEVDVVGLRTAAHLPYTVVSNVQTSTAKISRRLHAAAMLMARMRSGVSTPYLLNDTLVEMVIRVHWHDKLMCIGSFGRDYMWHRSDWKC
jgi:hypothetical protein